MSPGRNQESGGAPFDSPAGFRYIRNVIFAFFRLIFYAVVAYVVYKFVMFVLAPRGRMQTRTRAGRASGVMVKDQVCNTYLPREDALLETVEGENHYFCSQACRGKFLSEGKAGSSGAGRARS